jgi:hypothetical protein
LVVDIVNVEETASPTSSKAVTTGRVWAVLGTAKEHPLEAGSTPRLPLVLLVMQLPLVLTELPAKSTEIGAPAANPEPLTVTVAPASPEEGLRVRVTVPDTVRTKFPALARLLLSPP